MTTQVNRTELDQDIKQVEESAQRVYVSQSGSNPSVYSQALTAHEAVLNAFVTKYGSLRIPCIKGTQP